jgi:PAS domain S-box-containing protein
MTDKDERVERRRDERFKVQSGALLISISHSIVLGQVGDLSMGGLAFSYVPEGKRPIESAELNIFLADYGFHLDSIPFESIWDFENRVSPLRATRTKLSGVRFRGLTHSQISQLKAVLEIEQQRIAERKRSEKAIELAHAELNQIFETAADGMRVIDKDFNVLRSNKTLLSLSGATESKGRKCHEVFPGPMCHTPQCPLTRIIEGEERLECVTEKVRADGSKIPCILTATAFRDRGGELIGIVEDFRDISELKCAEEKREKLIVELQQALTNLKTLSGLLPVCVSCKKIRDDNGYWSQIEAYIREHSEAEFTHSICPDCTKKLYPGVVKKKNSCFIFI